MKKTITIILSLILCFCVVGCTKKPKEKIERIDDIRNLSPFDYTVANLATTDALGRLVATGDTKNDKTVGVFYHIWHGFHTKNYAGNYDITKLLNENPDALYDINGTEASPADVFHYWGEPLYGYYCSNDPWVITRHIELLTMAGVDYLVYDLTNSVIYVDAINAIFKELEFFQNQGFKVPKVAFYTNSYSRATINQAYNLWYKDGKYSDLWFKFNEKPLIIGVSSELTESERDLYFDFFDFRESQWPFGFDLDLENGFPWMDWEYPQKNYNGTMSVSLAQHPGARMSDKEKSNNGRGFDYKHYRNDSANTRLGTNYEGQWDTAYKDKSVNNVFLTGFNEWIAIKLNDGSNVFFVDTFNEEYSRDIEMMKGGYADNYYLQTVGNNKKFKYSEAKHYKYNNQTINIEDSTFEGWKNVKANFKDFKGDARARDFRNANSSEKYIDNSNRNDITDVSITHDANNLYVKVVTDKDITSYNGSDQNWMNILIKTKDEEKNFGGYNYILNRSFTSGKSNIEKSTGGFAWENKGSADYKVFGNVMVMSIPLSALNLTKDNCSIQLKVADNITKFDDIEDYYVSGDSAPIGRLSYSYGY